MDKSTPEDMLQELSYYTTTQTLSNSDIRLVTLLQSQLTNLQLHHQTLQDELLLKNS